MSRRLRLSLFLIFFLLFCFGAFALVFYSNGWRVNFNDCDFGDIKNCHWKFQKTGGIFIETEPRGVEIDVNSKKIPDGSGLLKSGTLIPDLLPRQYKIKISKSGYFDYWKDIKVESALVAELIHTKLIAQNPEVLKVFPEDVSGGEILDFASRRDRLMVKNFSSGATIYNLADASSSPTQIDFGKINKAFFYYAQANKMIIENQSGLHVFNLDDASEQKIASAGKNNKIVWDIWGSKIYFFAQKSLQFYDLRTKSFEQFFDFSSSTSTLALAVENLTALKVSNSAGFAALQDKNGALYLLDFNSGNLKKIARSAGNFVFSPDDKKLAFVSEGKLKIYFLADWYQNFKAKARDIIRFNLDGEAQKIVWYKDSLHLIILFKNGEAKFLEIDNRPPQNIFPLLTNISDIFYDSGSGKIYFLKDSGIFDLTID